tara:strand:+ start:59 stop:340 length:282 start_codon:yes stop_codon:yes gene_type:complete
MNLKYKMKTSQVQEVINLMRENDVSDKDQDTHVRQFEQYKHFKQSKLLKRLKELKSILEEKKKYHVSLQQKLSQYDLQKIEASDQIKYKIDFI